MFRTVPCRGISHCDQCTQWKAKRHCQTGTINKQDLPALKQNSAPIPLLCCAHTGEDSPAPALAYFRNYLGLLLQTQPPKGAISWDGSVQAGGGSTMKSSSLFASPGAHVDSKLNSQLRRSSRVSSSNGFQLKACNRSLAVGEACAKAKDRAKALCQAKEKKPFLTCCEITFYSYKETYYFPRYKNNLQFLTILPAVLHESKAKQPAGCVLRAD